MTPLQAALKVVLANTFTMYAKSHTYHWNVVGLNFNDYHGYFGTLYEELFDAVDPIAEHIRALDGFAPYSLQDLCSAATIKENTGVIKAYKDMFDSLLEDNGTVVDSLKKAYGLAQEANEFGLMHFLSDRLDTHAKHGWQLRSFLK